MLRWKAAACLGRVVRHRGACLPTLPCRRGPSGMPPSARPTTPSCSSYKACMCKRRRWRGLWTSTGCRSGRWAASWAASRTPPLASCSLSWTACTGGRRGRHNVAMLEHARCVPGLAAMSMLRALGHCTAAARAGAAALRGMHVFPLQGRVCRMCAAACSGSRCRVTSGWASL